MKSQLIYLNTFFTIIIIFIFLLQKSIEKRWIKINKIKKNIKHEIKINILVRKLLIH